MKLATIAGRPESWSDVIGVTMAEIVRLLLHAETPVQNLPETFLEQTIDPSDRQDQLDDKNVDSLGVVDIDTVVCSHFTALGTR